MNSLIGYPRWLRRTLLLSIPAVLAAIAISGCYTRPPQRLVVVSFNRTNGDSVTANILNSEWKFTTNSVDKIRAFSIKEYNAQTNTIVILGVIPLDK